MNHAQYECPMQYKRNYVIKELFTLCALKPEGSRMHVKCRARRIYVMEWETIATKIQTKDKFNSDGASKENVSR